MPAGVGGAVPATGLCWLATIPANGHKQTTEAQSAAETNCDIALKGVMLQSGSDQAAFFENARSKANTVRNRMLCQVCQDTAMSAGSLARLKVCMAMSTYVAHLWRSSRRASC